MEAVVHFPGMEWLDGVSPELLLRQIPVLLAGIVIYVAAWLLAYKAGAQRFSQVDL